MVGISLRELRINYDLFWIIIETVFESKWKNVCWTPSWTRFDRDALKAFLFIYLRILKWVQVPSSAVNLGKFRVYQGFFLSKTFYLFLFYSQDRFTVFWVFDEHKNSGNRPHRLVGGVNFKPLKFLNMPFRKFIIFLPIRLFVPTDYLHFTPLIFIQKMRILWFSDQNKNCIPSVWHIW